MCFVACVIAGPISLIFCLDSVLIAGWLFGLGLMSTYLLKVKKMEESNEEATYHSIKNSANILDKQKVDENDNGHTKPVNEIEIRNVRDDNKWNNIDRTESISINRLMT
eukprot:169683_1